jgi:uncharacterized protein (TIGR02246 family)
MVDPNLNIEYARRAIDAGNAQWIAAFRQAQPALLAELFDEQGVMLAANGDVTRGRAAIRERMTKSMQRLGRIDFTIKTLQVWLANDVAYETGSYTSHFRLPEQGEVSDAGRYMVIWKPQADGTYRIAVDMALPDEPESSGAS